MEEKTGLGLQKVPLVRGSSPPRSHHVGRSTQGSCHASGTATYGRALLASCLHAICRGSFSDLHFFQQILPGLRAQGEKGESTRTGGATPCEDARVLRALTPHRPLGGEGDPLGCSLLASGRCRIRCFLRPGHVCHRVGGAQARRGPGAGAWDSLLQGSGVPQVPRALDWPRRGSDLCARLVSLGDGASRLPTCRTALSISGFCSWIPSVDKDSSGDVFLADIQDFFRSAPYKRPEPCDVLSTITTALFSRGEHFPSIRRAATAWTLSVLPVCPLPYAGFSEIVSVIVCLNTLPDSSRLPGAHRLKETTDSPATHGAQ